MTFLSDDFYYWRAHHFVWRFPDFAHLSFS